jgi:hypothetical protein
LAAASLRSLPGLLGWLSALPMPTVLALSSLPSSLSSAVLRAALLGAALSRTALLRLSALLRPSSLLVSSDALLRRSPSAALLATVLGRLRSPL